MVYGFALLAENAVVLFFRAGVGLGKGVGGCYAFFFILTFFPLWSYDSRGGKGDWETLVNPPARFRTREFSKLCETGFTQRSET